MRHLSKSASLFGIGAFVLLLAVLSAVAGSGTASADSSDTTVQRSELCTYSEYTATTFSHTLFVDRPTTQDGRHGWWRTEYEVTLNKVYEVELCPPRRTERLLRSYYHQRWVGVFFVPADLA